MRKIPVIIDCDPGYDDAIALVLALGSENLDVKAITATAGNINIARTYKNAIRICHFLGKEVPIGRGLPKPLKRDLRDGSKVHSKSGLDGSGIPEDVPMPLREDSIDIMRSVLEASEEQVTIIPIGPQTNVARLLRDHPELKRKINRIVFMGGTVKYGNVSKVAEYNIFADPEAARIVFGSGVPLVMAGLGITNRFQILPKHFKDYRELGWVGEFVANLLEQYNVFYQTKGRKFKGPAIHDVLAVAYVCAPELFNGRHYEMEVICEDGPDLGRIKVIQEWPDIKGIGGNVFLLERCDEKAVIRMLKAAIVRLQENG